MGGKLIQDSLSFSIWSMSQHLHSVLPYGMLLTTIFQQFDINLDGETDIHVCKPSDAIANNFISRLGYELMRNQWVLKTTRVLTTTKEESDKEAAMDIPPPSPVVPSPTTMPSLTIGVGSSTTPFDYASAFQTFSERLDSISLDVQQIWLDDVQNLAT